MDATAAIQSATKNAVKGLGNTNMSAAQVTATLSVTIKTVVNALDEVEGESSLDLGTVVVQVTESSIAGLADLQQTFANDASFEIGEAVKEIAKGAIEGSGNLATGPQVINLTTTIGNLSGELPQRWVN